MNDEAANVGRIVAECIWALTCEHARQVEHASYTAHIRAADAYSEGYAHRVQEVLDDAARGLNRFESYCGLKEDIHLTQDAAACAGLIHRRARIEWHGTDISVGEYEVRAIRDDRPGVTVAPPWVVVWDGWTLTRCGPGRKPVLGRPAKDVRTISVAEYRERQREALGA